MNLREVDKQVRKYLFAMLSNSLYSDGTYRTFDKLNYQDLLLSYIMVVYELTMGVQECPRYREFLEQVRFAQKTPGQIENLEKILLKREGVMSLLQKWPKNRVRGLQNYVLFWMLEMFLLVCDSIDELSSNVFQDREHGLRFFTDKTNEFFIVLSCWYCAFSEKHVMLDHFPKQYHQRIREIFSKLLHTLSIASYNLSQLRIRHDYEIAHQQYVELIDQMGIEFEAKN